MKVLVVDDHAVNRFLPTALLRRAGCEVWEAASGDEALALVQRENMDCVLLDISMPGMSGTEVCKRLRASPDHAKALLIAYTAHALPDEVRTILAAGFDQVLTKPIQREALLQAVGIAGPNLSNR